MKLPAITVAVEGCSRPVVGHSIPALAGGDRVGAPKVMVAATPAKIQPLVSATPVLIQPLGVGNTCIITTLVLAKKTAKN